MPELPEVQTTVNGLNATVCGLSIIDVWTDYDSQFHRGKDSIKDPAYFKIFRKSVAGSKITKIDRLAKNILINIEHSNNKTSASNKPIISKSIILIHMKMTGHLLYGKYVLNKNSWKPAPGERPSLSDPYNRFIHFVILLSNNKHIVLCDTRKFAKVTLIAGEDRHKSVHLAQIGPDPLTRDFTFEVFKDRLGSRSTGRIKNVLMDQSVIAGVGNIYSDEALWRASVHPEERVMKIPEKNLKLLYSALQKVLFKGIDFGGDSMSDYRNIHGERGKFQEHHRAYQRKGEKCTKPGCLGTIIRKMVGGRSAHFCDTHQKLLTK